MLGPDGQGLRRPGAALTPTGELVVAAVGADRTLVHLTATARAWSTPVRHEGTHVARDEIETSGPAVVAYSDGDDVSVFYLAGFETIAAVTRREGVWSQPVTAGVPTSLTMVATPTKYGKAAVLGLSTTDGEILAVPFSRAAGFGAAERVDGPSSGGGYAPPGALAATDGACGDDAWFVYGVANELRFARLNAGYIGRPAAALFALQGVGLVVPIIERSFQPHPVCMRRPDAKTCSQGMHHGAHAGMRIAAHGGLLF